MANTHARRKPITRAAWERVNRALPPTEEHTQVSIHVDDWQMMLGVIERQDWFPAWLEATDPFRRRTKGEV